MRLSKNICPRYQAAVEIIAQRWTALIIKVLMPGPRRFSELADELEVVSDRVLSERLKELEQAGILTRRVIPDPPIRVEYTLTEKGQALGPIVDAIETWSHDWIPLGETAAETVAEAANAPA
jgi:DNA-binding HxlR family transcriptional regulator